MLSLLLLFLDQSCKVWDIHSGSPSFIAARQLTQVRATPLLYLVLLMGDHSLAQGPIYTCQFSPDEAFSVAVGGRTGGLRVYDIGEVAAVHRHFEDRILPARMPVNRQPRMTDEQRAQVCAEQMSRLLPCLQRLFQLRSYQMLL